jgi:hypothetical protein
MQSSFSTSKVRDSCTEMALLGGTVSKQGNLVCILAIRYVKLPFLQTNCSCSYFGQMDNGFIYDLMCLKARFIIINRFKKTINLDVHAPH